MRNLILFLWKYRFFLLFFLLEFFSITLIVSNNSYQRSKFISASNGFTGNLLSLFDNATVYFSLKSTNTNLAEENARLKNLLQSSHLKLDTSLVIINDSIFKQHYQYQESKVLSNSFQKRNNYLIINKGLSQGYSNEMGVVGPNGVVGIINSVSENFSSVLSVLHSRTAIDAKIKNSGYTGTLTWDGKNYRVGQLENIPAHVKINVGDTIVTSGYSFIFPEGLLLGTVKSAKEIPGRGFYHIDLNFSIEYNQIEYVYVISNLYKDEESKLKEDNDE